MTDIETRVRELLDALGSTTDQIAASLKAKGIKGLLGHGCSCPIYNYLVGEGVPVREVDSDQVTVEPPAPDAPLVLVDLTDSVSDFVWSFDLGRYPELVETAVES